MRDGSYLDVWARLKPGVTMQEAQAQMNAIAQRLEKQYPNEDEDTGVVLVPLREEVVGSLRPMLLMLFGAVSFVLLIACANVANLLLARAATRSREIAIRTALGASRLRLIRQLLTESVLLALLGGALGLLLATWALPVLLSLSPPEIADFAGIGLNRQVLAFSILASVVTGTLFGLAPALFGSRANPTEALREGERGSSLGRSPARSALIAVEIALSLVLLVGAGLMMKSFVRLTRVDPGFNPDHLLVFNIGLARSADATQQTNFYHGSGRAHQSGAGRAVGRRGQPAAAGRGNSSRSFSVPGDPQSHEADVRVSTPDYLPTMGIPLVHGRHFTEHDTSTSLPVAIINQATAASAFKGRNPIGQYLTDFGPKAEKLQIVGVVGNVRHIALEKAARPEIYVPFTQTQWPSMFFAVRSAVANPLGLLARGAERGLERRSQRTAGECAHDAGRAREVRSAAKIRDAAPLDFCRPRHAPRGDRTLRRDLVFRGPAHEGNRNPDGARRAAQRHAANGLAAKWDAGPYRNAGRRPGRVRGHAIVRHDALRRRRDRCGDLSSRPRASRRGGISCQHHPRAPRHQSRSDGRASL